MEGCSLNWRAWEDVGLEKEGKEGGSGGGDERNDVEKHAREGQRGDRFRHEGRACGSSSRAAASEGTKQRCSGPLPHARSASSRLAGLHATNASLIPSPVTT